MNSRYGFQHSKMLGLAVVSHMFEIPLKGGNIVSYTGNLFSCIKILNSQSARALNLIPGLRDSFPFPSPLNCHYLFLPCPYFLRRKKADLYIHGISVLDPAQDWERRMPALCLPLGSNTPHLLNTYNMIYSGPESNIYFNLLAVLRISLAYEYLRKLGIL